MISFLSACILLASIQCPLEPIKQPPSKVYTEKVQTISRGKESHTGEYMGLYDCTVYILDLRCVPNLDGITASGKKVKVNHTVTGPFPLGTKLYIEGLGVRVVEDTSDPKYSNRVDIYADMSYEDALKWGKKKLKVWVVE